MESQSAHAGKRRRWLLVVLFVLLPISGVTNAPRLKLHYDQWRLRRMTLAQLQSEAKRKPRDILTRYSLGAAYARANQEDLAIPEYLAVLRLQPNHAKTLNDLGVILMARGKQAEALLALRGAVQANPTDANARANLGRLYLAVHSPYSATNELSRAAALDPSSPLILSDLGIAHQDTMNFNKALEAYKRATELSPQDPDLWSGLGETYRALARYDEAKSALRQALRLNPKHSRSLGGLGRLQSERAKSGDEYRQAATTLKQAIAADPLNTGARYYLGCVWRKLGDERGAIDALEKVLAASPIDTAAMYQLGLAYVAVGRKEEGQHLLKQFEALAALMRERDLLEKRIDDEPDNLPNHVRLAELYLLFQEPAGTVRECRFVLDREPRHAQAHDLLTAALQLLAQQREAEQHGNGASAPERGESRGERR